MTWDCLREIQFEVRLRVRRIGGKNTMSAPGGWV